MKRLIAVTLCWISTAATAEVTFNEGDFFMAVRSYDWKTDSFTEKPPEGEEEACFVVTANNGNSIDFRLVSGYYKPWWSNEVILPGAEDTLGKAIGYAENHPDAPDLAFSYLVYENVQSCGPR